MRGELILISYIDRKKIKRVLLYFFVAVVFIMFVAPLLWLVISSLQTDADLLSIPPQILPKNPTLSNYYKLLLGSSLKKKLEEEYGVETFAVPGGAKILPRAIMNSFIIGVTTTLLCLIVGSFSAYSLARLKFAGSKELLFFILGARMVPGLTLIIPFFLLVKSLGMIDKKITLIIIYSSFALPYTIWLLKGFFETIPPGIEDAGRIDGCTRFQTIFKIILPISKPALVGVGVLIFMLSWNEFFYALILTNIKYAITLPVVLSTFATEIEIDYSLIMASGVIAVIPPIVFTFIFQRYIVKGLVTGSLKG